MPKPTTGRGGAFKAALWALVALILLGALAWWLFSGPDKREALRGKAADTINELASGTPLQGIGDVLRESPPPLPPQITNPPTESGTLSGRQVTGTIASPIETGNSPASSGAEQASSRQLDLSTLGEDAGNGAREGLASVQDPDKPVFSSEPIPPATEDSRVKPGYLADLANWLAARYRPGPNGGTLELSPRTLNNLCGVTLAGRSQGGRSGLLRYAFQASMLDGLYRLYIGQFMTDLNQAAAKRGFNTDENRDFHHAIAGRVTAYANAMDGILRIPDLGARLASIDSLGQKSVEENAQLAEAVFELDQLREQKASRTQIEATQMRVTGITARYRRAIEDQESAQRALAAQIRKEAGQGLDEDALLFMAAWVQRRLAEDPGATAALRASVGIMRDLAQRCALAAE